MAPFLAHIRSFAGSPGRTGRGRAALAASVLLAGALALYTVAAWAHEPPEGAPESSVEAVAALPPEASEVVEQVVADTLPAGVHTAVETAVEAVESSDQTAVRSGSSAVRSTSTVVTAVQQATSAGQVEVGPVPPGAVRRSFRICMPGDQATAQAIGQFIAGRSFSATLRALPDGCAELIVDVNTTSTPSVQSTGTQTSILSVSPVQRDAQTPDRITVQISTTRGTTTAVISNTLPKLDLQLPEPSRRALEGLRQGDRSGLQRFLDELLRSN